MYYDTWAGLPIRPAAKNLAPVLFYLGCPPGSLCSSLFHLHQHMQESLAGNLLLMREAVPPVFYPARDGLGRRSGSYLGCLR